MKKIAVLSLGILMSTSIFAQNVGTQAPNFSLNSLEHGTITLDNYKGKVVMIFFFGYACPPCIAGSAKVKSEIINVYGNDPDFVALGIDTWDGNSSAVRNFRNSTGLDIPLLMKGSSVASAWRTTKDRLFIIDHEGKVVFKGTSGVANDAKAAMSVTNDALKSVSTALTDLRGGEKTSVYPNPMQNLTTFKFNIDKAGSVNIKVLDLSGKMVFQHRQDRLSAGTHTVDFHKEDLPKGVYFYQISNENTTASGKLIIE